MRPDWEMQAVVAESLIRIAKGLDDFDSDEKLKEKFQTILKVKNSASFQQFFQHILWQLEYTPNLNLSFESKGCEIRFVQNNVIQ